METGGEEEGPPSLGAVPGPSRGSSSHGNSDEDLTQPAVHLSGSCDPHPPPGRMQHHDHDQSTVPKQLSTTPTQLAQPMDVEASFSRDMMEASIAGAVAPGYTTDSNQQQMAIHNNSEGPLNIANTINSSNYFKINAVHVHNQVHNHNHNHIHSEQHVHQHNPGCTYVFNNRITGGQSIPLLPLEGVVRPEALTGEVDQSVDNVITTDNYRKALDVLTTGERHLLLSAHPGHVRQSFLSALRRHFHMKGYTVYGLTCVTDWDRKGVEERGSLVIFDSAFGDVRLDREQYHAFYKHSLYSINSLTKLVFVVHPPVLLELQQHDRASDCPIVTAVELVELGPDLPPSVQHYADLLVRMLRDPNHRLAMAALLALAMQGQGCFLDKTGQVQPLLQRLGFSDYTDVQLEEYGSLLKGFLLQRCGRGLINREAYQAVGLAFAETYLKPVLVQVCDIKYLVNFLRTEHIPSGRQQVVVQEPDTRCLLMQRMCEEMVRGRLPEMIQHPCLHNAQFLQEFEEFCREKNCLQAVMGAVDPDHNLPLLYWSVWGLSQPLNDWCLGIINEHEMDSSITAKYIHLADFANILLKHIGIESSNGFQSLHKKTANKAANLQVHLPVPSTDQRHTAELRAVCDRIAAGLSSSAFQYLGRPILSQLFTIEVEGDIIHILCPSKHMYLAYRLLTDQQVDEQDENGNTLLHLAAYAGHPGLIKMAISSGASLTSKNQTGKTPPELAKQRCSEKQRDMAYLRDCLPSLFDACKTGNMTALKEILCTTGAVDSKNETGLTSLHIASANCQADVAALLTDLHADLNASDYRGRTALHLACEQGSTDIVHLLICKGADVNAVTTDNKTPLHYACEKGYAHIAGLLINHGTDVNVQREDGSTALHIACRKGDTEIVRLLVENKASPGTISARDHRRSRPSNTLFELPTKVNINIIDKNGFTALCSACKFSQTEIVQLLLQQDDIDVNAGSDKCFSPLQRACLSGNTQIVQLLLDHNSDVNMPSEFGFTPLYMACVKGYHDIVHHLLQ